MSHADELIEALATALGKRLPDAPAAVALLPLAEVCELLEAAGALDDWPILVLAVALEEIRDRERHQAQRDRSIGGRRHRGGVQ
ncbi:MAG TPA: hypothetical protein VII76_05640 [Acidimicrobiales bacterium]